MDYISALFYGLIQGLCEFLPISSSGHLALLPLILKIQDPGLFFDLMMHLGTSFSVLIYFRKRLQHIFISVGKRLRNPSLLNLKEKEDFSIFANIFIATLVSIMAIIVLRPFSELYARNPQVIAFNLIVFGFFLFVVDWKSHKKRSLTQESAAFLSTNIIFATLVGLAQAIAIFPGVSRSGITLTAVLLLGSSRRAAAEFIFLLSLPIIIIGALKSILDLVQAPAALDALNRGPLILGLVVSFLVGLAAIHYFLKWIKSFGMAPFALYRLFLGLTIIYFSDFLLK